MAATVKGRMRTEYRDCKDKYTLYTCSDLDMMGRFFGNRYGKEYGGEVAENYGTWCENYARLYGNLDDGERSKIVWYLGHLADRINVALEENGSDARMEANAKISFDGGEVWDTISTIE